MGNNGILLGAAPALHPAYQLWYVTDDQECPGLTDLNHIGWIEVRHISTGRLEQVIEGSDIRLAQTAEPDNGPLLLAMKGSRDDAQGLSDKLVEVLETRPLSIGGSLEDTYADPQWGEWDI